MNKIKLDTTSKKLIHLRENLESLIKDPAKHILKDVPAGGKEFMALYNIASNYDLESERYKFFDDAMKRGAISISYVHVPGSNDRMHGWMSYGIRDKDKINQVKAGGLAAFKEFYEEQLTIANKFYKKAIKDKTPPDKIDFTPTKEELEYIEFLKEKANN